MRVDKKYERKKRSILPSQSRTNSSNVTSSTDPVTQSISSTSLPQQSTFTSPIPRQSTITSFHQSISPTSSFPRQSIITSPIPQQSTIASFTSPILQSTTQLYCQSTTIATNNKNTSTTTSTQNRRRQQPLCTLPICQNNSQSTMSRKKYRNVIKLVSFLDVTITIK